MSSSEPRNIPGDNAITSRKGKKVPEILKAEPSQTSATNPYLSSSVASSLYGPNLIQTQSYSPSRVVDNEEVRRALDLHLVSEFSNPPSPTHEIAVGSVGSISHNLVGGAITRDIYKWKEDYDVSLKNTSRSRSVPDLAALVSPTQEETSTMTNLNQPGGFRRHFIRTRAEQEGRDPPNFISQNFLDFLALYGNFAGQELSDSDEDYEEEQQLLQNQGGVEELGTQGVHERAPLLPRRRAPASAHATASTNKAFFLLVKSFVGTGVLFLPKAFYNGGLLFSTIILCVIAYICLHCMILLVECSEVVSGSFGDIGEKLYGRRVGQAVLVSIILSQLGFVCAYFVFVGENLRSVVMTISKCELRPTLAQMIFIQLILYIPFALVRKIKYFSSAALIADVFILLGLAYIFYFDAVEISLHGPGNFENFNPSSCALMIGTALFTFEGIGLILPISQSMKNPEKFPKVLSLTMFISTSLFAIIGSLCYYTFGDKVQTVVLLNLPPEDMMTKTVQLLYSFSIAFSVPLQLFPAIRILEQGLVPNLDGKKNRWHKWQKNVFRAGLVIAMSIVSYGGSSSLDKFVSLIGSFACVPLSFMYPSLFHYKAVAKTTLVKAKDLFLFYLGGAMMIYVTYISLSTWHIKEEKVEICG